MVTKRLTSSVVAIAALALVMTIGGCSSDSGAGGGTGSAAAAGDELVFWTQLNTPDRLAKQVAVAAKFTAATGIKVKVVGLAATDANQSMASQAASGKIPDIVQTNLDQITSWNRQGLIDADAATAVVAALDPATFNPGALQLVKSGDKELSVPADGWGQMLFYRKDLFAKAGLKAPSTIDEMVAAAQKLKSGQTAGIVLGTKAGDGFTDQTLEWLALSNGCELVKAGTKTEVTINSPQCIHVFDAYQKLIAASVTGAQDVTSTRAAYLSGRAAMTSWSPHLLDELAGLDANFPPTCAECKADIGFLSKNTGIVTDLHGPDVAKGKQYGITLNLSVMKGSNIDKSKQFVQYLLSDGYPDYLTAAPEGRYPLRNGTKENPKAYTEAWADLPIGTDPKNTKQLRALYGDEFVESVSKGATSFARWGYSSGDGELVAAVITAHALGDGEGAISEKRPPEEIAAMMKASVEAIAQTLQ